MTSPSDDRGSTKGTTGTQGTRSATGRGALSAKNAQVFKWKLMGRSGNVILTLFKAAEREEAEAQLERLRRERYYSDLRILDIDTVVPQRVPVGAKKGKKGESRARKQAKAPAGKAARARPKQTTAGRRAAKSAPASKRASTTKASPRKGGTAARGERAKAPGRRALKKKA